MIDPTPTEWDDIINGVRTRRQRRHGATEPHPDRPARHAKTPTRRAPDNGGASVASLITGVAFLMAILCAMHLAWLVGGNGLDSIHQQEMVAVNSGFDEPEIPEGVAMPQDGEPPVDGQPQDGQFVGWMYIPRLGADWKRVIQQGTDKVILDNLGLGHYEHTVMPGGKGNSAYAGHRTPSDLGYADRLEAGDSIIIQTAEHWYVYDVQSTWVTDANDTSVLDSEGEARWLTLTTCDPMFQEPAPNRLIVRADFDYWANVSDGQPAELTGADTTIVQDTMANITNTIRDISKHAPVTPLFAAATGILWLLFTGVCWLLFRHEREPKPATWNILTILWRVQCGPTPIRVITFTLMWATVMFAFWAWASPLISDIASFTGAPTI